MKLKEIKLDTLKKLQSSYEEMGKLINQIKLPIYGQALSTFSENLGNVEVDDAHITGIITVGHTEAKCTDPNADQTSANPQSVSWLTDAGAMAYEDLVEKAKLGTTIIDGGYIKTDLLTADNIITGTLTGRTVRTAISGKRVEMQTIGDYANSLTVYNSGGNLGLSIYDSSIFGGWSNSIIDFDVIYGLKVGFPFPTADAGYIIFKRNSSQSSGACSPEISGYPTLKITGLSTPSADYDAATKKYVDDNINSYTDADARGAIGNLVGSDGTLDKSLDCDGYDITDLDDITCRNSSLTLYLSGGTTYYLTHNAQNYTTHYAVGLGNLADTVPESTGIWDLGTSANRWHTIYLTTNPDVSSSKELKKNIENIEYGLSDILKLNPVKFEFKDEKEKDKKRIGLIAEDVQKVIPEISDGKSYKPVSLIPILINAVKELNNRLEAIEKK